MIINNINYELLYFNPKVEFSDFIGLIYNKFDIKRYVTVGLPLWKNEIMLSINRSIFIKAI